jgi:hypothetical protein
MPPRILFAAPQLPYPPDNGWNQRMLATLEALSSLGEVELVCYDYAGVRASGVPIDLAPLERFCARVHRLPHPGWPAPPRSAGDVLRRLMVAGAPTALTEFPGRPLAERAAGLAAATDLIWAVRLTVGESLTAAVRRRTIVDVDGLESEKRAQQLALSLPRSWRGYLRPWPLAVRLDLHHLRWLERSAPSRYASTVVCSERQRAFFPARLRRRVAVVPNGVPRSLLDHPRPEASPPATLVFVGSMVSSANGDAIAWFVRDILPRVAAAVPEVRLEVVGQPTDAVRALHDGARQRAGPRP